MTYTAKHATPTQEPEVLTYDPYAKVIINTSGTWSEVVPEVFEAHQATSLYTNQKIYNKQLSTIRTNVERVRDYLMENYDELELHADEIANLLDIELTKTVELDVDVTFTVTVELQAGQTADDIDEYDFDVEITSRSDLFEIADTDYRITNVSES